MKVAILQGTDILSKQLLRSLLSNQIKGDLITRIDNRTLMTYDFIVVHHDAKASMPVRVLEQIVLQKQAVLVYLHHQENLNHLYNLTHDPYFLAVSKVDVVQALPGLLWTIDKWRKETTILKRELDRTIKRYLELKSTAKAKRILMRQGMTEEDAHNWIQKEAMDKRCKKIDVVNLIIEENIDK
jgi:response regulator NasT